MHLQMLFTVVQKINPVHVACAKFSLLNYVEDLYALLLGLHGLGPAILGECPLAIKHDGIVVEFVYEAVFVRLQLVELVQSLCNKNKLY